LSHLIENTKVFANKGTAHFALEQDRAILCAVEKHGYGNWEAVKEDVRNDQRLKFQHSVQGMSIQAIIKRCDYRMRQMEKEVEARERIRKNRRPQAVVAAQQTMESMKQMDEWDTLAQEALLSGKDPPPMSMSPEARSTLREQLEERNAAILRLREIEVQYRHALQIAENTRENIYNGAQYVNYSSINMKAAGTVDSNIGSIQDDVKLEAAINARVLKIPECGVCTQCAVGRLCENRLVVRERMIFEAKKIEEKKKGKKRPKSEPTSAFKDKDKEKPGPAPGPGPGPAKKKQKKAVLATPTPSVATSSSAASSRPGRPHQGNRKK
jgi:SLIDE